MNRTLYIFLLIIISVSFFSCDEKDNNPIIDERVYSPSEVSLDLPSHFFQVQLPSDNPLTKEGIELGRHLFYERMLSGDNSQSCASCHNQSVAFTDNGKKFSIGIEGTVGKRNSMPLWNLFYHDNGFFWDGRAKTLREQALLPIEDPTEMNSSLEEVINKLSESKKYSDLFYYAFGNDEITSDKIGLALEHFMFSIISGNSKWDRVQQGLEEFTEEEKRGEVLFNMEFTPFPGLKAGDCFHCHGGPDFSNHDFSNNGLDENLDDLGRFLATSIEFDKGKFKVPSLRNIELTAPYMHDGRFETLEEVLDHYNEHVNINSPNLDPNLFASSSGLNLDSTDKANIIAFLKTLTDSTFLNNPAYSDPN